MDMIEKGFLLAAFLVLVAEEGRGGVGFGKFVVTRPKSILAEEVCDDPSYGNIGVFVSVLLDEGFLVFYIP
jgi:hypothetical protein